MGFYVGKKPVPIVASSAHITKNMYQPKNILAEYYKNVGRNYARRNDVSIYLQQEEELKNIADSTKLSLSALFDRYDPYIERQEEEAKKNEILTKNIENYASEEDAKDFLLQIQQLHSFQKNIDEYVKDISRTIQSMDEDIPES